LPGVARITVFGGTGYTGHAIAQEAAKRGHEVTSVSRTAPATPIAGVTYIHGSLLAGDPASLVADADVVVSAVAARGELAGKVAGTLETVAELAEESGTRLVVVGGFTSLRRSAGGPRICFSEELPAVFAAEAREMAGFADWLPTTPETLNWLYLSPGSRYGSHSAVPATGSYQLGGDVALPDAEARAPLSAPDLAAAVLDLIEGSGHHREHVSIAS
jgi:putative NADH-flavin reductase